MNAINHAATALLINKKWPGVPIIPVLLSVQLVEFLWVAFNLLGVEVTTTEPQVRALNDIHLAYMPYSHSIAATAVLAFAVWVVVAKLLNKPTWGLALAAAVSTHIVLDIATHAHDIALSPGIESPKFGSDLYAVPLLALVVETIYGVWCWWIFRGSKALLAVIVAFNLAALSFYSPSIPGPEHLLAGHPKIFSTIIGVHIVAGLVAVGFFARSHWRSSENGAQQSAPADRPKAAGR
ncbi:MAG: hypothetical protein ACOY5V_07235 [Pseudomonadota bacterium]